MFTGDVMNDKIYEITDKGKDDSISIIDNGTAKIKVYEPLFSKSFLYPGDKIKVEMFGEYGDYKQAVVSELVEKTSNHEFNPKYYPEYMYMTADKIEKTFGTKEQLIEEEKKEHYDYISYLNNMVNTTNGNQYFIEKCSKMKELTDAYLFMLEKCKTWEEIEKIYNQRPLLLTIR